MISLHAGNGQPLTKLMILQQSVNVITQLEQQVRGNPHTHAHTYIHQPPPYPCPPPPPVPFLLSSACMVCAPPPRCLMLSPPMIHLYVGDERAVMCCGARLLLPSSTSSCCCCDLTCTIYSQLMKCFILYPFTSHHHHHHYYRCHHRPLLQNQSARHKRGREGVREHGIPTSCWQLPTANKAHDPTAGR